MTCSVSRWSTPCDPSARNHESSSTSLPIFSSKYIIGMGRCFGVDRSRSDRSAIIREFDSHDPLWRAILHRSHNACRFVLSLPVIVSPVVSGRVSTRWKQNYTYISPNANSAKRNDTIQTVKTDDQTTNDRTMDDGQLIMIENETIVVPCRTTRTTRRHRESSSRIAGRMTIMIVIKRRL